MISVVLVTYNEGDVLKECLESVTGECDEIVILDLRSSDNTLEIAKKFKVKIFTHKWVDYVEKVRNIALSKTKGDWILVLDPDERMNKVLWLKLRELKDEGKYSAVNIPRKNIFFDSWIKHTNWWPDRHVRFFQKGKVEWSGRIHLYPNVEGQVFNLPAKETFAIEHIGYSTVDDFIDRQSRYSVIEAKNLFESGIRFSWMGFVWKPIREFLVRFIWHLGFMDGKYGFLLTYLMMIYQLHVMINLWELEQNK